MPLAYETRRYLTSFDSRRMPNILTDVLIIGGGVAGLRAAVEAARHADVIVVAKDRLDESNTARAQGGIAAALADDDQIEQHLHDTLRAGAGLCDENAARLMVENAPACIRELIQWGARFDTHGDELALGREAGHATSRVVHARGDATGLEILSTLRRIACQHDRVRFFENCFVIDLLTLDNRCLGAVTWHPRFGHQLIWASATILASGGCGAIYRETTNSPVATGDGIAQAYRAGAELMDLEMVQFHPTTLYIAGAARALISEAVRGEGAYLINRDGKRFMLDVHPDAELAPRDIVSRAIVREMARTHAPCVYLDARHLDPEWFRKRFPGITRLCEEFGLDLARDPIPVRPSAHYMIGGVRADMNARTSIGRLWAVGEVAATGVHGANRLASNSLLEGLVFGRAAGADAAHAASRNDNARPRHLAHTIQPSSRTPLDINDVRNSLRSVMTRNAGIERNGQHLLETADIIRFWGRYVMDKLFDEPQAWEVQNMLTVARLIVRAAWERRESRGVHFRSDFPDRDDRNWQRHIILSRERLLAEES